MSSSYISSNKIIPNNMSEGLEKQKASYTARGSALSVRPFFTQELEILIKIKTAKLLTEYFLSYKCAIYTYNGCLTLPVIKTCKLKQVSFSPIRMPKIQKNINAHLGAT